MDASTPSTRWSAAQRVAFHALERWKRTTPPRAARPECSRNAMARKRPHAQLAKCAEAQSATQGLAGDRKRAHRRGDGGRAGSSSTRSQAISQPQLCTGKEPHPGCHPAARAPEPSHPGARADGRTAQADHANRLRTDHCAAIEGPCDTAEWRAGLHPPPGPVARKTGDTQNIDRKRIKQIAGEAQEASSAGSAPEAVTHMGLAHCVAFSILSEPAMTEQAAKTETTPGPGWIGHRTHHRRSPCSPRARALLELLADIRQKATHAWCPTSPPPTGREEIASIAHAVAPHQDLPGRARQRADQTSSREIPSASTPTAKQLRDTSGRPERRGARPAHPVRSGRRRPGGRHCKSRLASPQ